MVAAPALAQEESTLGSSPEPVIGGALPDKPKGYLMSAREAIELADTDPKVIQTSAERGRLRSYAEAKPPTTWQIGYYDGDDEVVQVQIDDPSRHDPRVLDRATRSPGRWRAATRASSATC